MNDKAVQDMTDEEFIDELDGILRKYYKIDSVNKENVFAHIGYKLMREQLQRRFDVPFGINL